MQIDSRIHIVLKSHKLWNELKSIDFQKYNICTDWIKDGKNSLVLDDWYCDDSNAKELVTKISDILGTDVMVFYDSSSTSVDPYAHLIYSVGIEVHEKEFDFDEFCYEQDNRDLCAYLSYKRFFTFSKEELAVLKKFGIEQEKGKKHSFKQVELKKLTDNEILSK